MQEGMCPVLEWTFLQPGQRIVVAQTLSAARGKGHCRDSHTASQGSGCVLEELQSQIGAGLSWRTAAHRRICAGAGEGAGRSSSSPGETTAPLKQWPGGTPGAGNEGME